MCNDAVTVMHECCSSVADVGGIGCLVTRDRQRLACWRHNETPTHTRVGHALTACDTLIIIILICIYTAPSNSIKAIVQLRFTTNAIKINVRSCNNKNRNIYNDKLDKKNYSW